MEEKIADIRKDYTRETLTESEVDAHPVKQFEKWWKHALDSGITEVNAMTLATASADGMPSARIMLLKGFSEKGFLFFTNYNSFKGQQLSENPRACLVFFWKELERQVRVTGIIRRTDGPESDTYFHSRPRASQIGALASPQSQVVESREWLDHRFEEFSKELENKTVDRPSHWGGFIVKPIIVEFWQGRPGRLHDRLQYSLSNDGSWKIERLAP